jgi:Tfp pilus assembly protein FimV
MEPSLRLTRRGRVVVLIFLALVASLASAVLFTTASHADGPPPGPAPTIVVRPGDTLWGIASREIPRRDNQDAVDELRRLNDLRTPDLQPGEILTLPRKS